jgi:hypothetical protein
MSAPAASRATERRVSLHVPEEPVLLKRCWQDLVVGNGEGSHAAHGPLVWASGVAGSDRLASVVAGGDGVVDWLWSRWRHLAATGLGRDGLASIALGYEREIWLWLLGERTWAQCCSGLIGRIERRMPS